MFILILFFFLIVGGACWYGFQKSVAGTSIILAGILVGAVSAISTGHAGFFFVSFSVSVVTAMYFFLEDRSKQSFEMSLNRFKVMQQVFFSAEGNPIVGGEQWNGITDFKNDLIFQSQSATTFGGLPSSIRCKFADVICITVEREIEKSDLGKTLGRVATAGLAYGLIGHAIGAKAGEAGLGGAVGDFAFRGAEKRSEYQGSIVFTDGAIISFHLAQSDMEQLYNAVPSAVTTDEAVQNALDMLRFFNEMADEGELGIKETIENLVSLNQEKATIASRLEEAGTIAERKEIRIELSTIENQIRLNRNCLRYIVHRSGTNLMDFLARHQEGDIADLDLVTLIS